MPKGKIYKVPVEKEVFQSIVKACHSSIIKLGDREEIKYTERTIRRSLNEGKMTPELLNQISMYLNVDPRLLSGELHKKAESYTDELLKSIYVSQLTAENYPYFRKRKKDIDEQPIRILLEQLLSLFEISILQFDNLDFEVQYSLQQDLFNSIIPIIKKYFKEDAYGRYDMPNLEKIIFELENFREDYYLTIYAEDILRKKFSDNPPHGKKKSDIRKMNATDLILLDMGDDS